MILEQSKKKTSLILENIIRKLLRFGKEKPAWSTISQPNRLAEKSLASSRLYILPSENEKCHNRICFLLVSYIKR